jgi:hypothetical protein
MAMNTGGRGNEGLMVLVPIAVSAIILVILAGGPENALQFVNDAVRHIVYQVTTLVSAWL